MSSQDSSNKRTSKRQADSTERVALLIVFSVLFASCTPRLVPDAKRQQVVEWRTMGSWSGHGNIQTESFLIDSGALRIRWETLNEQSGHAGKFRLILQSAVSGRQLAVAAEQGGIGKGESYVSEGSRQAYVLVESSDIDWSFTVDEGVVGTIKGPSVVSRLMLR